MADTLPQLIFFSVNLLADPSGFGDSGAVVSFYNRSNVLPATQTLDQTSNAFFTKRTGIQKVVLIPDACYDDPAFHGAVAAAPEPGGLISLGCGMVGLTCLGLRRIKTS